MMEKIGGMLFCIIFSLTASLSLAEFSPSSNYIGQTLNASCIREIDCRSDQNPTYLKCVRGRCLCDSHTLFDAYEGKCRIKWPSQCQIKLTSTDSVQPCVRFSHCAFPLSRDGTELTSAVQGTCQCLIDKEPKPDGTCGTSNLIFQFGASSLILLEVIFTLMFRLDLQFS